MEHHKLWLKISHQVSSLCARFDDLYLQRKRRLSVSEILMGVLKLKSGTNQSYQSLFSDWVIPLAGSSFSEARVKIPASLFSEINKELLASWSDISDQTQTWNGFTVYAIDGSKVTLPLKLKSEGFRVSRKDHYPQGLLSTLFRVFDRVIYGLDFSSNKSERLAAIRLCEDLGRGDLVILDKGYFSFPMLCELVDRRIDVVFAIQEGQSLNEINAFRDSDLTDLIIEVSPSIHSYRRAKRNHPEADLRPRKLRLIKYTYAKKEEIIGTTVLDESINAYEIVELYAYRWRIEELYKAFKVTLSIEKFHSKTAIGVEQELHAASILWNLSRKVSEFVPERHFKKKINNPKISHYQVNFTQALASVREHIRVLLGNNGMKMKTALRLCIQRIARTLLPVRPGRHEKRKNMGPRNRWHDSAQRKAG